MLSNQVLHKILTDIQKIMGADCCIWNTDGEYLEGTCPGTEERKKRLCASLEEIELKDEKVRKRGAYFLIRDEDEPTYVLEVLGNPDQVEVLGRLCANQFEHLLDAYRSRLDKNRFFQNLLLDNLLLVDIFSQAKKINIDTEKRRIVFVVEPTQEEDSLALKTLKGLYATGNDDYVTSVDEQQIVLVKTVENTEGYSQMNQIARTIVDVLNTEVMINVRVAYGTIVDGIQDVSKSYKEATMALDVGRSFYAERTVLAYNELGIGRLIHQLPMNLCDMFLKEVFTGNALELLDEETLLTVDLFFKNSLNISETARKLYVHRNTLVYRLEKIQKITGLDVRTFDDALTFKIALMVSRHMKSMQSHK